MFNLSVISPCEGTVRGLKVPTLSMGYFKNVKFWCNKNFACKEQMMAARAVSQDYHIHFEDIEVFVKSFKLSYVRNLTGKYIPVQSRVENHHAYYEETKGTSSLFTLEVLLSICPVSLYLIWLFPGLCCNVFYSHAGFSLFKTSPPPQSHKMTFLSHCSSTITTEQYNGLSMNSEPVLNVSTMAMISYSFPQKGISYQRNINRLIF
jgi:hypothetical protein